MADFVYNKAKKNLIDGTMDLVALAAANKLKMLLLEAAADENPDDNFVADVIDGTSTELAAYTRHIFAGEAATQDDPNDRAEFDADNSVFSAVVAQNAIVAYVIYEEVTNDADNIPIMFVDETTGLPITPNGSDITITWNAEGILQLT